MDSHPAVVGKRVLYIEQRSSLAGSRFSLLSIVRGARDYGMTPIVVCGSNGPLVRELRIEGIDVKVIDISTLFSINPCRIATNLFSLFKLWHYSVKMRIDLIHTNSFGAHIFGGIVARALGKKTVWHIRELTETIEDTPQKKRWRRLIVSFLLFGSAFLADKIICVSNAVRDHYINGSIGHKMVVIHNGIDTGRFRGDEDTGYLLAELGLGAEDRVVSIFARLSPWKGHHWFLRGAARIKEQVGRARFLIVGSQMDYLIEKDYEEQLRKLARDLGLENDVIFTGFRNDVPALMALSDVIVSTSYKEPFGRVILEAGAVMRPVVAFNSGGHLETVVDGVTGFLVPYGDVEALARKVAFLLEHEETASEMGRNARNWVEREFSLDRLLNGLLGVYEELLVVL